MENVFDVPSSQFWIQYLEDLVMRKCQMQTSSKHVDLHNYLRNEKILNIYNYASTKACHSFLEIERGGSNFSWNYERDIWYSLSNCFEKEGVQELKWKFILLLALILFQISVLSFKYYHSVAILYYIKPLVHILT